MLAWGLCGVLAAVTAALLVKIRLMYRSMDEIRTELADRLSQDTNGLIGISSRDRHIRRLTADLNKQLRLLRAQRRRYLNGDRELKEAVTHISHDLRTPLTAICGYMELLKREETGENVQRYLSQIEGRVQAMRQLTEELFRYSVILSSPDEFTMETVDVGGVLEESIAAFYAALTQRGIEPELHITEKKIERPLNRGALSRVFGNILSNCLKYSDGDLEIRMEDSGEIVFSNTARQMNGVQVGKLFDRFFTVEAARNSTGLGLAIARVLVEQMNGTICAQYEEERLSIRIAFERGASE